MPRPCCSLCQRPVKSCICRFIVDVQNDVHVVVLQHPSEVKQSKGTISLLSRSLARCEVIIGEDFSQNEELLTLLREYKNEIALLYPSEHANEIISNANDDAAVDNIRCIILLDGTWKKSYRMFMLSACLHDITHIVLPTGIENNYQIRKTQKENALSSLEACCHALARLENNPTKYQVLINSFVKFNQFQLSFIPKETNIIKAQ
jgi:DTW domain-containing protein YfiP